jgi:hypothetical protein
LPFSLPILRFFTCGVENQSSGVGLQKFRKLHRLFVVTLSGETKWTELVETGCNALVAPRDKDEIGRALGLTLDAGSADWTAPIYGDGHADERIATVLFSGHCE